MKSSFERLDAFENTCEKNSFVQIAQRIAPVIKGRLSLAQCVPEADPGIGALASLYRCPQCSGALAGWCVNDGFAQL